MGALSVMAPSRILVPAAGVKPDTYDDFTDEPQPTIMSSMAQRMKITEDERAFDIVAGMYELLEN